MGDYLSPIFLLRYYKMSENPWDDINFGTKKKKKL
jgi:hypothetical protein